MAAHAVISGAGIAGPALAHQLTARGWRCTVIERYPERRDEGQNVDIRGAARQVVRRMGIEAAVRQANTGEVGTRFVTPDGHPAASFPVAPPGESDGPTADLEILRGELSRILIEATPPADYLFDTQITDVTDHRDHVSTVLSDGRTLDADLLVIAEGLHSRSRRYVTPAEVSDLGMFFAYVTLPRIDTDNQWWNWQHADKSRAVHLRPDNVGTTRAILSFFSDVRGLEGLDRADLVRILRRTFAGVGGAAPRVLDELEAGAPMYFSAVGQIQTPSWSKGRITLLGDAAFCNATFGGAGTSLALIGAYILAGELADGNDIHSALTRYQHSMRPFVDTTQRVSPRLLRLANPRTRAGIRVLHGGARLAASPVGKAIAKLTGNGLGNLGGDQILLPHYPEVTSGGSS